MCNCNGRLTPADSSDPWPAAITAACGVIVSPVAMRRLGWIIFLMIVLVVVTKLPWSELPWADLMPTLP